MSYTKSTALAIKGEYCKKTDLPPEERYTSSTMRYYQKPLVRQEGYLNTKLDGANTQGFKKEATIIQDPASMTLDTSNM